MGQVFAVDRLRSRRRLALILVLASAGTLLLVALRASDARAWAWKDNCTAIILNQTGSQSAVRPIVYTPAPPWPLDTLAQYGILAANGVPLDGAGVLLNTGIPVPTYGCHAIVIISAPGSNVNCKISAPTTGANTFSCDGNSTVKIIKDDDDIAAKIFIPQGSGVGSRAPSSPSPRTGPLALRAAALPGKGWKRSKKIASFGLTGTLMNNDSLSGACASGGRGPAPRVVSTDELVRNGGSQGVGAVVGTYATEAQARRTVNDALSQQSIGCLERLLTSARYHTSAGVLALPPRSGAAGRVVALSIHRRLTGGARRTEPRTSASFLEVIGKVSGRRAVVELLEGGPSITQTASLEQAALRAVRL
jgi:hypothetical protein